MTTISLEVLIPQVPQGAPKAFSSILVKLQLKFHQGIGLMWDSIRSVQSDRCFYLFPCDSQSFEILLKLDSWGEVGSRGMKPSCLHNSLFSCGVIARSKTTIPDAYQPQRCGSMLGTAHWTIKAEKQPDNHSSMSKQPCIWGLTNHNTAHWLNHGPPKC